MEMIGMAFLMIVAVAVLGAAVLHLRIKAEHAAEQQRKTEQQLQQFRSTVSALEARLSQIVQASPTATPKAAPAPVPTAPAVKDEEITPELLVVMAAAVTVFLGKTVRIRSAKMLQSPYEIVNPWAQQGRVFVQASHNLRTR